VLIALSQKQGILPLWLVDKSTYSQISEHDTVSTLNLAAVMDGSSNSDRVILQVRNPQGEVREVECGHTLSSDQVEWLRAGSALNWIGETARRRGLEQGI
jgi:aconitase A